MPKLSISFFIFCFVFASNVSADTLRFGEKNWQELASLLSNKNISPHWRDEHGHLAAYLHLNYGSELAALSYIERVKSKDVRCKYAEELLPSAVYKGSQFMTRSLLKLGASPNPKSKEFYSPLMIAASKGELEIMRILLSAGADPYFASSGDDVFSLVLKGGHDYALDLLLDWGVKIDKFRRNGSNSLFFALIGNSESQVNRLVEIGFPINGKNDEGDTLLTFAVKNNVKDEILKLLILKGLDQCETDKNGLSPLQIIEKKNKSLQPWDWKYEGIFLKKCIAK